MDTDIQMRSQFKSSIKKAKKLVPLEDGFSQSSRVLQIKTTQDYFQSVNDIDSVDYFVL
jgi:hypothetical protein